MNIHVDWERIRFESLDGTLLQYMQKNIPKKYWGINNCAEQISVSLSDHCDRSLLYYACLGNNIDAIITLVKNYKINVNLKDKNGDTPSHILIDNHPDPLEILTILCALGADHTIPYWGETFLNSFLRYPPQKDFATLLISNGMRLDPSFALHFKESENTCESIIWKIEQGVLSCRNLIVTLLGLKKRRGILPNLDRLLIKGVLAVEIWATRTDRKWYP